MDSPIKIVRRRVGSRGAAMREPYSDDRRTRHRLGDRVHRKVARLSSPAAFSSNVHAIGDRGNRVTMGARDGVEGRCGEDTRFRVEPAQTQPGGHPAREARFSTSMKEVHRRATDWAGTRVGEQRLPGSMRGGRCSNRRRHPNGSRFPSRRRIRLLSFTRRVPRTRRIPGRRRRPRKETRDRR